VELETSPLRTWLPVIIWTGIIAVESLFGSAANTRSFMWPFAKWMFGYVDPERLASFHHILRKAGHFFGYGIFGILWFRGFLRTYADMTPLVCAALAVASTFLVASLDEWHQSLSATRTGQFSDVLLDTSGTLVLVPLALIVAVRRQRSNLGIRAV
jgi:VanZ family protein